MGNVGELRSGGAQWMAAGHGVIHSEMPMMEEGALPGFQIWINQPATHTKCGQRDAMTSKASIARTSK